MRLFDLHCDTLYECVTKNKKLKENDLKISLEKGKIYSPWIQCFAVWIPDELRGSAALDLFYKCRKVLMNEKVKVLKSGSDVSEQEKLTECGAFLAVEGGSATSGTIEGLENLYNNDVRLMTLTWNGENELGFGSVSGEKKGLKPFGKSCVRRMGELGMIVDVSHLNDYGFYDVAEISEKPFIATHSNSRSVANVPRNLTDEQFKFICSQGGLVGINFYHYFLNTHGASKKDLFNHIEHFLSLGGEDTLALGSDFDGADMPSFIKDMSYFQELYIDLEKLGYSPNLIDKIFYSNAANFFQNNLH